MTLSQSPRVPAFEIPFALLVVPAASIWGNFDKEDREQCRHFDKVMNENAIRIEYSRARLGSINKLETLNQTIQLKCKWCSVNDGRSTENGMIMLVRWFRSSFISRQLLSIESVSDNFGHFSVFRSSFRAFLLRLLCSIFWVIIFTWELDIFCTNA